MPLSEGLTTQELLDRYSIDEDFLRQLVELRFLKPIVFEESYRFGPLDCLRLEVVLKGLDLEFRLPEIADIIRAMAPSLDGMKI